MWDTRRYRSDNAAEDDESKTMLGLKQREDFFNWVARVSPARARKGSVSCSASVGLTCLLLQVNETVTWKFVVSSVPVMSLWSEFTRPNDLVFDQADTRTPSPGHGEDTWAAFLSERDAIMDVLEHVPNVIVLSGDRHEFAAASIRTTVTEFSTSP